MGHDFVDVGRCTRETQPGGLCQFHDKLCVRCGRDGLLLRRAQGQLNEPLHSRRLPQLHLVLHFSLVLVASHANYISAPVVLKKQQFVYLSKKRSIR